MKLLPYQTQSLDVAVLLSLAGLQNFNGSFNLVFDVEGSVLMASGSVDQKNTYVFEVVPTSVKETFPTPPFPDFVSGHSTYSAAAARILELWTGSERFGDSVTLAAGSSKFEAGLTPARPVTLRWETFTDAADEAGLSRRYGGIHFRAADLAGRILGGAVAVKAWSKAQAYFQGTALNQPSATALTQSQTPSSIH